MTIARPIRLRHSGAWGASVPGHEVQPGQLIVIKTRSGKRRVGVVLEIVHREAEETLVSLVDAAVAIPQPKKAK